MRISNLIGSLLKRLRSMTRIDPSRDWLIMLVLSAFVLAGSIVWNVWTFNTVANGGSIGAPADKTSPIFSRSSLDAIRAIFAQRAAEEAKYETGVYQYTDPSQ